MAAGTVNSKRSGGFSSQRRSSNRIYPDLPPPVNLCEFEEALDSIFIICACSGHTIADICPGIKSCRNDRTLEAEWWCI